MATASKSEAEQAGLNLDLQSAKGWRPKKGDELVGTLVSISRGWSDWASAFYPILTVEKGDGSLTSVHCFHSVLVNRVMDLKPRVGETVGIKCHGQEKTNDGKRTVTLYSLDVARDASDPSDPYAAFEDIAAQANAQGNGDQS